MKEGNKENHGLYGICTRFLQLIRLKFNILAFYRSSTTHRCYPPPPPPQTEIRRLIMSTRLLDEIPQHLVRTFCAAPKFTTRQTGRRYVMGGLLASDLPHLNPLVVAHKLDESTHRFVIALWRGNEQNGSVYVTEPFLIITPIGEFRAY